MRRAPAVRWSFVKILLIFLNVVTTILTLTTGLWYTPVVTSAMGRDDYIRRRLLSGSINQRIAEPTHYRLEDLATPRELADYAVVEVPRRDPRSFSEYHSVCTNINTMAAPVLLSYFDDFWGKGPRRVQTNVYSISAPHCDVVTVTHAWRDKCVRDHGGDARACHAFVLDHFDALQKNKSARAYAVHEFGTVGVPFLRCFARPLEPFPFYADLLSYEMIWAGSDRHVIVQTSECRAEPLAQSADQWTTLFQAVNVDEGADMVALLPPKGWIGFLILWIHSIATVVVISHGMILTLLHSSTTRYLPEGVRFGKDRKWWLRYLLPFMPVLTHASDNERAVITFKGALFVASDVWKTHWMYMWLSVLDGLAHLRKMYVVFQLAGMLRFTPQTFIYLCGAITKITWVMCFVETLLRVVVKLLGRCLRSLRLIGASTRRRIEWDMDGVSMFLSWRIFNLILSVIVMLFFQFKGTPTLMEPADPPHVGAYGGAIRIASFWGSELACDIVTLLGLLTLASNALGLVLIKCTKYRYVADNSIMRLLGDRYWLSGWDGLMAADMLGLDPTHTDFLVDGHGYTKFSLGTLLTLMYQSGPSGLVHLAGDYIFHDGGFSKDPVRFAYPITKAVDMGLVIPATGSAFSSCYPATATVDGAATQKYAVASSTPESVRPMHNNKRAVTGDLTAKMSIFERKLRVVSDGYFGKLLFVDAARSGQIRVDPETGRREYEVVDALTTMSILDIKYLMGRDKKIRVQ